MEKFCLSLILTTNFFGDHVSGQSNDGRSSVHRLDSCAMLSPIKGETAVHGYHWPGDMVVRLRKVLAIPWSWYVCFSAEFSADKYNNTS